MRFGRFYLRRVRRLLPALAVVLVVVAVCRFVRVAVTTPRDDRRVGGFASVFLANAALYLTGQGYFAAAPAADPGAAHVVAGGRGAVLPDLPACPAGSRTAAASARGADGARSSSAIVGVVCRSRSAWSLRCDLRLRHRAVPLRGGAAFYLPVRRAWEFGAGATRWRSAVPRGAPAAVRDRRGAGPAAFARSRPARCCSTTVPARRRLLVPVVGEWRCAVGSAHVCAPALSARPLRLDRRPLLRLVPVALAADRASRRDVWPHSRPSPCSPRSWPSAVAAAVVPVRRAAVPAPAPDVRHDAIRCGRAWSSRRCARRAGRPARRSLRRPTHDWGQDDITADRGAGTPVAPGAGASAAVPASSQRLGRGCTLTARTRPGRRSTCSATRMPGSTRTACPPPASRCTGRSSSLWRPQLPVRRRTVERDGHDADRAASPTTPGPPVAAGHPCRQRRHGVA